GSGICMRSSPNRHVQISRCPCLNLLPGRCRKHLEIDRIRSWCNVNNLADNIRNFLSANGKPCHLSLVATCLQISQDRKQVARLQHFAQIRRAGQSICRWPRRRRSGKLNQLTHLLVKQRTASRLLVIEHLRAQISPHLRFARPLQCYRTRQRPETIHVQVVRPRVCCCSSCWSRGRLPIRRRRRRFRCLRCLLSCQLQVRDAQPEICRRVIRLVRQHRIERIDGAFIVLQLERRRARRVIKQNLGWLFLLRELIVRHVRRLRQVSEHLQPIERRLASFGQLILRIRIFLVESLVERDCANV